MDWTNNKKNKQTGDLRVNEFIGLTAMNEIWMREHNRVTDFFIKLNPHWDDERLFQESRRIVIAEMQHVVYNEFIPLLLGKFFNYFFILLMLSRIRVYEFNISS